MSKLPDEELEKMGIRFDCGYYGCNLALPCDIIKELCIIETSRLKAGVEGSKYVVEMLEGMFPCMDASPVPKVMAAIQNLKTFLGEKDDD